ncbi:MAG TPA: hypothetical protein VGL58_09235 [Caulobacteraceae bacterium]|jgi:hypothetical protein
MTDAPTFATLEDVNPREAWVHEAQNFTPWLAENLNRLGEAIGIPLEHVRSEAAVETFAADILARNPQDDTLVLIENQLEASDHGHLGQIMTYLAGLSAQTIIWVAPSFREPHLSAIRWLNQHTADTFAFFAVKLRVVRIGGSPFAPLFEVLERPNGWDRRLQEVARDGRDLTELGAFRMAFWTHFLQRHPSQTANGRAMADPGRWIRLPVADLVVVQYVAKHAVGLFIRGPRSGAGEDIEAVLRPHETALTEQLGTPMGGRSSGYFFDSQLKVDTRSNANWDRMSDWLASESDRYVRVLTGELEAT